MPQAILRLPPASKWQTIRFPPVLSWEQDGTGVFCHRM
jgi:hypothetical protein